MGSRKVHNSDTELPDRNRNKPRGRQGSAVGCRILYLGPRGRSWRSYDGGVWVVDLEQARLNEGLSFDPSVRMAGVGMQIGMAVESLPVLLPLPLTFPLRWSRCCPWKPPRLAVERA